MLEIPSIFTEKDTKYVSLCLNSLNSVAFYPPPPFPNQLKAYRQTPTLLLHSEISGNATADDCFNQVNIIYGLWSLIDFTCETHIKVAAHPGWEDG